MTNLSFISLPDSARMFLEWIWGSDGLCARMSSAMQTQGKLFTLLPEGTSLSRAEQYKAGGVMKCGEASQWLARHLCAATSGVLLIQDLWMTSKLYGKFPPFTDLWIRDGELSYLGAEVKLGAEESVGTCFGAPRSFYYVGFLIADAHAAARLEAGLVRPEDLAESVTEMYVPAYDRESFVIWKR